jgi:hypothetical protein
MNLACNIASTDPEVMLRIFDAEVKVRSLQGQGSDEDCQALACFISHSVDYP